MKEPWQSEEEHFIRIENVDTWKIKKYKNINPANELAYTEYWSGIKKKFIEGFWGQDFGKWRYMPGTLYFYINMCVILHADKRTKTRKKIRPELRDLEWSFAYMFLIAKGFSGFMEDEKYTCWHGINTTPIEEIPEDIKANVLTKEGHKKVYVQPKHYLYMLHDKPLGPPLYDNNASNVMILGSRGGGKSYYIALAEGLHQIVFDGAKYYTQDTIENPAQITACVGSGDTAKSGEFLTKMEDCMNEFATNPSLGVWGKPGDFDYMPNPFYKDMSGSTAPGNKKNGGWRHSYKKNINGRWVDGFGTGSSVYHVSYSDKKSDGAEAAAGGRYTISIVEECGLTSNVREVYNSNIATVSVDASDQFGVQAFLGTSGNMDTIIGAKEMFTNTSQYNIVPYRNIWEGNGTDLIGFFLPAYMTSIKFKDKNGNTDFKKAKEDLDKIERKLMSSNNPLALRMHRMNYPTKPSHMWVSKQGYILPSEMAAERVKELELRSQYKTIGTPIKLRWDSDEQNRVVYDIDLQAEPFYEIRGIDRRETLDGCIMMYEPPVSGEIPADMYAYVGHDPYVSDNREDGQSLGATHVIMNPKYWTTHLKKSPIVATYIGKPEGGKEVYYQNQEKLLAFYGNPVRGLWYEADRGDACRDYYLRKHKTHLLAVRPQHAVGSHAISKKVTQYGWVTGNKVSKINHLERLRDWLLEDITLGGKTMKIIETIPCIFTLKEIAEYDLDEGNFDAVMSLAGAVLGIREDAHKAESQAMQRTKNALAFISTHNRIKKKQYERIP